MVAFIHVADLARRLTEARSIVYAGDLEEAVFLILDRDWTFCMGVCEGVGHYSTTLCLEVNN